jgi:tRNA threonylcarbamoyladenosine biosynthesis protein TsaB
VSIILNIETAVQTSSICLAENDRPISVKINPSQKDSAAWLHVAINEIVSENHFNFQQLDAIAVSEGPGSYTGLRVGMATAKGLCYVLNRPLITINTLRMIASAVQKKHEGLLCPMIDARRMEVFTAVFDQELNFVLAPTNIILNEDSFEELIQENNVLFCGNGAHKFQQMVKHSNAVFDFNEADASAMTSLSYNKFLRGEFADLAYSQPFYGKDFHSSAKQSL